MTQFKESTPDSCTFYCKYYRNPICGGYPTFWGVFIEYDFQALTTQGAYDPWRYVWYSVVVIRLINIQGGLSIADGLQPERYYLHAVDTVTGKASHEYQMKLTGILYGMQYDIDGTRLVALYTEMDTGRIRVANWKYKLATILINTTFKDLPKLSMSLAKIAIESNESEQYLQFSGASGILSQQSDCYIITQAEPAELKKDMKDRVFFVRIPDGFIMHQQAVDFKILQIYTNEKYGDVTVLGPRQGLGLGESAQSYVDLARVTRDYVEEATIIEWLYNPINPPYVTDLTETRDMMIYPGVAASEHLYNYSAIAHRRAPVNETGGVMIDRAAFLVAEVNLRTGVLRQWCNRTITDGMCVGSMDFEIPYAGLYNEEPGIPLSLKAPAFVDARFTMEAGTIIVNFDRATLQGAKTKDDNFDYVPDRIDYETKQVGFFDCAQLFQERTIELLGPFNATECVWMTDSRVQINLPAVINISVGDSLYVLADTVYTIPTLGEWSPAAMGGVQVFLPDPLEPPVIVLTGTTTLDTCSDLSLSARDSFQTGKLPKYTWEMVNSTDQDPNPKDLTNNPIRVIDDSKVAQVLTVLSEATTNNWETLEIPTDYMEAATSYTIRLSVMSRWLLTTVKTIVLTKLNFPAPMVSIMGAAIMEKKRTDIVTLAALGEPSACANASDTLGFRWLETTGKLNFEDYPDIQTAGSSVSIPAFVLEPDLTNKEDYNEYNFTVECFVNTLAGNVPSLTASAYATVRIFRSAIYVVFRTESRMITRNQTLVLDARPTMDPDYPTEPDMTFKGTFTWRCLDPERKACFGGPSDGSLTDLETCRQDINDKIQDGGVTFYAPLFDGLIVCEYARGVLMFRTSNFSLGEYKFTVEATSRGDGRKAQKDVLITTTDAVVPKILLEVVDQKEKYPTSVPIRIKGSEEGETENEPRTYSYTVYAYLMNPEYNPDLATERANDADNPYTVDKFKFVEQSDKFDTSDPVRFESNPNSPNLVINSNVLSPSTTYMLRLNIQLQYVTGYSDITIETAGQPPRSGILEVTPMNASMTTSRKLSAPGWVAEDIPLSYSFGYVSYTADGSTVRTALTTAALPVSELEVKKLVLGEESNNYTLIIYVEIETLYGAVTDATVIVQSLPVDNVTEAAAEGLADAANADPASVVNELAVTLSIDSSDPAVQSAVLDILSSRIDDVPQSAEQIGATANLIVSLVGSGENSDEVVDVLEATTAAASNAGVIDASVGGLLLEAMGGLMPTPPEERSLGPGGASNRLLKYRTPNPNFKFRDLSLNRETFDNMHFMAGAVRQGRNHPAAANLQIVISECNTAFCDSPGLVCSPKAMRSMTFYLCCDEPNSHTLCDDPPCWFHGNKCPAKVAALAASRRLEGEKPSNVRKSRQGQASQHQAEWFKNWKNNHMPKHLQNLAHHEVSGYEKAQGYASWQPDLYKRRLQLFGIENPRNSPGERLQSLENDEQPLLADARAADKMVEGLSGMQEITAAKEQVSYTSMSPAIAAKLQSEKLAADTEMNQFIWQKARNDSQRITRINVMRDTVSKALIGGMVSNEVPLQFSTATFKITIGKSTNLSNVHSAFVFPEQFQVPPDSPDFPTPDKNVTGFSFIYVEYNTNIYSFSNSAPISPDSLLITVHVWKASTAELDTRSTPVPIRIFADVSLYSNVICLFWDRFAAGTPGGEWSMQGVVNDGTGCLTSHLSDFGIFMDGRIQPSTQLVDAATFWEREVWASNCVGCGDSTNLFVVAVLGMTLFTLILLILLGYTMDESVRTDMAKNKVKSRYYFDGNGVDTPLSVDDPIAYGLAEGPLPPFWLATLWSVVTRDHSLISSLFYHETFTRPQRLQCFISLLTGLLAINAAVHSNPGNIQQAQDWFISGVLSGLLVFPIFCGLVMMFNLRPAAVKRRLIKRAYSVKEIDKLNEQRQRLANQSSMLPPPGYMALPPPPPGSFQGNTTLLSLPAPLPLPPLPAGTVGQQGHLALAPPPGIPTGLPSQLALPGMTGRMPAPPPPKFPPPPKNAKVPSPAALMPPLNWPKTGPAPTPFPALQDASLGGTRQINQRSLPGTGEAPEYLQDQEANNLPGAMVQYDGKHGMAPPGMTMPGAMPPPPPSFTPASGTPRSAATPPSASPAPSHRSGSSRMFPPGPPGAMVPADGPMPLFIRGQPPPSQPPPFPSAPSGPSGMMPLQGGAMSGMGGAPVPLVPPAPPPPPREDDQAFVRRIRLTYMEKVTKEHQKHDMTEDLDELGNETPGWVYDTMTVMPYLAASTFTLSAVFMVLQYGMKFQRYQEEMWLKGSLTGLGVVLGVLDFIRMVMATLVELRKYENRRKAHEGHFLPRRIKREDNKDYQSAPPPRTWKQAVAAPPVPKGPGVTTAPPPRPNFLPKEGSAPTGPPGMGNLPVASGGPPNAAPKFSAAAMAAGGGFSGPPGPPNLQGRMPPMPGMPGSTSPGPATPKSMMSGTGRSGFMPPPGQRTPGTPGSTARGPPPPPKLQSAADLTSGGSKPASRTVSPRGAPGPPSPAHSTHSLNSLAQSLNQQVKAGRHPTPPPPPGATVQPAGAGGPPPPPSAAPPNYSRPPSRPSSAGSAFKAKAGGAPPPPSEP